MKPTVKKNEKVLITGKDEKTWEEKHGAGALRRKHLAKNMSRLLSFIQWTQKRKFAGRGATASAAPDI